MWSSKQDVEASSPTSKSKSGSNSEGDRASRIPDHRRLVLDLCQDPRLSVKKEEGLHTVKRRIRTCSVTVECKRWWRWWRIGGVYQYSYSTGNGDGAESRDSANSLPSLGAENGDGLSRLTVSRGVSEPGTPDSQYNYSIREMLPADDGQSVLRQRIVKIRNMDVSATEKARLMHALMNERYRQTQTSCRRRQPPRPDSRSSFEWQGSPLRPCSNGLGAEADGQPPAPTLSSSETNSDGQYRLTVEDLQPTYAPVQPRLTRQSRSQSSQSDRDEDIGQATPRRLGCRHYKRNVKLQCSTCSRWYTCRFCHDEVEDHFLNRKETKSMLCMLCGCAQPAGELCVNCGESTAWYYCGICKLWDDDSEKSIYHCNDCGICRIGRGLGKDFFHCKVYNLFPCLGSLPD